MSGDRFLAMALDDEVIMLDIAQARLIQLDPWTWQVWEACDGRTTEELAAAISRRGKRLQETLRTLAEAGIIRLDGHGWSRVEVRWVAISADRSR